MLLAVFLVITLLPMTALAAGEETVSSEADFLSVLTDLNTNGGEKTIKLGNDITVNSVTVLERGTLTILGEGHTITDNRKGLAVKGTAVLNLGREGYAQTLTVISADNTSCIVDLADSAIMNMYSHVTLGPSRAGGQAAGVQQHGSTVFNMYGGTITECHNWASVSGAVWLEENAVFHMYDGIIENCSGYQGGAVGIAGAVPIGSLDGSLIYAKFHMHGGIIRNCTDNHLGGGAVCIYNTLPSRFVMDGGTISGCSGNGSGYGGAVFMYTTSPDGKIEINGGTITENTAKYGGGIFLYSGNIEIAEGASIYENTAVSAGDDIYTNGTSTKLTLPAANTNDMLSCGHKVDGWYDDGSDRWAYVGCTPGATANHISAFENTDGVITGEFALKAAHGIPSYKVSFNLNYAGAVGAPEQQIVTDGQTAVKPSDPVRTGWSFEGWYLGGTAYDFTSAVSADMELIAHWSKTEYMLSFDLNGGNIADGAVYSPAGVYYFGDTLDIPENNEISRNGYSFEGWFTDAGFTESWIGTTMPAENLTLYAKWKQDTPGGPSSWTLTLTKVDSDDHLTALSGAKFALYRMGGESDIKIGTYTTDNRGKIYADVYNTGDYYWVETQAPAGYLLNTVPHYTSTQYSERSVIVENVKSKTPDALDGDDHYAYIIGYPDGMVHPEANITRAEAATVYFRLLKKDIRDSNLTVTNSFTDVPADAWYNTAISTMTALGIINGYPDGSFNPDGAITRAEFAAIAARFDDSSSSQISDFTDINGHWAAVEISNAAVNGWVNGYPDGSFKPDSTITRAEVMALINRVINRNPENAEDLLPEMHVWPDNMDTEKWYYLDVQEATNSHDYKRKANHCEYWTEIKESPKW